MDQFLKNLQKAKQGSADSLVKLNVNEHGQLVIPSEVAGEFGLQPGAVVYADRSDGALRLRRPLTSLAKVYVEPTSACNLACRTCMRNTWDEPMGTLTAATWQRILESLAQFEPVPRVFFGGFGEPLSHPRIADMVAQAKALGAKVELITNGTLLDERQGGQLLSAGLDCLWVSLDGATPESYTDVRLAEAFPEIVENLARFQDRIRSTPGCETEIGVSFVAMKRNIADLMELLLLRNHIGASRYLITNVLPYTPEHCDEILYNISVTKTPEPHTRFSPLIDLPRLDLDGVTSESILDMLRVYNNVLWEGERLNQSANRCPFVAHGSTSIGWDGEVSPCLGLIHNYKSYFNGQERFSRRYTLGNVRDHTLKELWEAPAYLDFRERVQQFQFPPCTKCGGCLLSKKNEEDCDGNHFPTCGGCLWAQGVIRCP